MFFNKTRLFYSSSYIKKEHTNISDFTEVFTGIVLSMDTSRG